MPVTAAIQTRIAEDIALLHLFGENPNVPVRPIPYKRNMTDGYSISLEIEKEFASDMAFLSSIRDEPTKITAVAVHETREGGLRVLVAANASQNVSSQAYLEEVKRGFDSITRAMRVGTTSEMQSETSLLDLIVRMCKLRILQRIWRQDPTLLPSHLDEAIEILQGKKQNKMQKIFIMRARILLDNLRSLGISNKKGTKSTKVSDADVKALVECCCDWAKEQDLENFLKSDLVSNLSDFTPSKAWSICNIVRKIGRYQTCATRLKQLAVNNDMFREIQTACVSLDQEALQHNTQPGMVTAEKVMMRVSNGALKAAQVLNILQNASSKEAMSRRKFRASLQITQGEDAKVHAEVQLLWYFKSLSLKKPPRVIQSNKLACYLCSALIACTGEYAPARSHGKLYPGWRLPSTACNGLHRTFARCLEVYIVNSLKQRIESGVTRRGLIADCESSATVHRVPLETIISPLLEMDEPYQQNEVGPEALKAQALKGSEKKTGKPREPPHNGETRELASSSVPNNLEHKAAEPVQDSAVNGEEHEIDIDANREQAAPATSDTEGRGQSGQEPVGSADWLLLPRGQIVCTRLCETLQVLIENDGQNLAGQKELRVRIRQLCSGETVQSFGRQDVYIIDELPEYGEEVMCGKGGDPVLLRLGNKVYVVEVV